MKRLFLILAVLAGSTQLASASCVCRCMNGQNQPICDDSMSVPPICPPVICPIEPPSVTPIQAPTIPPIGTTDCRQEQVYNPYTQRYEWKTICH
jgi:hypothetical protein